jgi:D,D-heptose 1,7-bisphosphate phosphatase
VKLVIIAGGNGTRLGLGEIPKPMAEFAGKPLLEHQILLAARYGITDITILSGYLSQAIKDHFGDGQKLGVRITHLEEERPLGTAGAVKNLEGLVDERFMVLYGDVVLDMDLERMIRFDQAGSSMATLLVHPNDHPYDSDLVSLDDTCRITAFHSKPHQEGMFYRNMVNAGVYILDPVLLADIPADVPSDFGTDIFPDLIRRGYRLRGYYSPEYVKDMGTTDRLEKTRRDFASGKVARLNISNRRKAVFLDRDGVINHDTGNVCRCADFELIPGVPQAIKTINSSEYLSIVVTNQPVLAKGFCTEPELRELHDKMETLLGNERSYVDAIYYCPHHPERGFEGEVPEFKMPCDCRKPEPGLLLKAASEFNVDLQASWMIGDRYSDVQAGKTAGVRTILLATGHDGGDRASYPGIEPDFRCVTLSDAVEQIMRQP